MSDNLILVGFMGTGKSAIGRRLAGILKKPFYDADLEMEKVTGMSLMRLCQKYGKIRFQSEEKLVLRKLLQKDNSVIVAGGTFVVDEEWLQVLRQSGKIICLTARNEVIRERVLRRNNRPFLRKECINEDIAQQIPDREMMLCQADFVVDTSDKSLEEVFESLDEVMGELENDGVSLEDSFRLYNQGMELLKVCNDKIDKVEKQIKILDEDGEEHEF